MKWLIKNWYNATPFLAIYTTGLLLLYVAPHNFPLFLLWLQTPVYFTHEFEEYILPGGFKNFFNTKILGSRDGTFPLDDNVSFWINMPIIFIAMPISAMLAGSFGLGLGIWTASFSVLNALSHVVMAVKYHYNPGLIVSVVLNIPVGLFTLWYFMANQLISVSSLVWGTIFGIIVQLIMIVYGFGVLKPKIKRAGKAI